MGTFIRGVMFIKIIELVSHYYYSGGMLIRQSRVIGLVPYTVIMVYTVGNICKCATLQPSLGQLPLILGNVPFYTIISHPTVIWNSNVSLNCHHQGPVSRGHQNGRPIVWHAILALSDKWLSLDTRPMDKQIIIAQMSFINLGQIHIWFRTSADAMLLVRRMSASQISRQPLVSISYKTSYCKISLSLEVTRFTGVMGGCKGPFLSQISVTRVYFWLEFCSQGSHFGWGSIAK